MKSKHVALSNKGPSWLFVDRSIELGAPASIRMPWQGPDWMHAKAFDDVIRSVVVACPVDRITSGVYQREQGMGDAMSHIHTIGLIHPFHPHNHAQQAIGSTSRQRP